MYLQSVAPFQQKLGRVKLSEAHYLIKQYKDVSFPKLYDFYTIYFRAFLAVVKTIHMLSQICIFFRF